MPVEAVPLVLLGSRTLPDGRILELWRYIFNIRLTVSQPESHGLFYEDAWCFKDAALAATALEQWSGEGEPDGWIKHPTTGRWRPDGDRTREETRR